MNTNAWHEDISEKNFVYPLGNVQYLGGNTDGLTGITNGAFTGFETYSLFGNWQTPSALIGKGYVWSNLTEAQKRTFIANPENNCYLDGDKVIQVRYRLRVVQGWGDDWGFGIDVTRSYISPDYGRMCFKDINNSIKIKGKLVSSLDLSNGRLAPEYCSPIASLYNSYGQYIASTLPGVPDTSNVVAYEGNCYALPIALVHRKNQGISHPTYNPNGSKKASDDNFWYNTAVSFTSISDCFDPSKLLTASGYIGTVSGRPDGLFYDQVHEGDILDLRNSSKKPEDYNRLISREFNKLVAGTNRGKEGEYTMSPYIGKVLTATDPNKGNTNFNNFAFDISGITPFSGKCGFARRQSDGRIAYVYSFGNSVSLFFSYNPYYYTGTHPFAVNDILDIYLFKQTTRTKSNTLLHCDIIGNPSNYPTAWKESGVSGTPLIVAEDGTSLLPDGAKDTFKLSRKANTTPLLCLRSTDSGVTWTSFTPTFSTTTNEITLTDEPAGNLVMVYYQTKTSMAVPVANSEVLGIGDCSLSNYVNNTYGVQLCSTLLNKVSTNTVGAYAMNFKLNKYYIRATDMNLEVASLYAPEHLAPTIASTTSPTVKVFPYLTRLNGKAYLNLVFKEMKHNGTSWGDDAKFNIVNNVSVTTDNNAQTVLIGQKTVELPYFIGADE